MTKLVERDNSIFFETSAILVDDSKDVASSWAAKHIYPNPALKWVVAKYVEADTANSNGQYWSFEDLQVKYPTVNFSPMNIDHQAENIVGTWVASEIIYPLNDSASGVAPYVEVLGVFWKAYFPDILEDVQKAFDSGSLSVSMECVGGSVTCVGTEAACGQTFEYAGAFSDKYCSHINERASYKQINNPHFLGGALILPPNRPGWKSARVNELASDNLLQKNWKKEMRRLQMAKMAQNS